MSGKGSLEERYFTFKGTQSQVVSQIESLFEGPEFEGKIEDKNREAIANGILSLMERYQTVLGNDEMMRSYTDNDEDGTKLVWEEKCLYINVRRVTVLLLLLFLERTREYGFVLSALDSWMGNQDKVIAFLKEMEGQLCILMETARCGKKGTDESLLEGAAPGQECVNNHYKCRYNCEGKCSCKPENVKDILKQLCDLGALKMKWGRYYYVPDFSLDLLL